MLSAVITTINAPTNSVVALHKKLKCENSVLIVVGDMKGPETYDLEGVVFHSYEEQKELNYLLIDILPTGHYARKNLGYLEAIRLNASVLYETDDDNAPNDKWVLRSNDVKEALIISGSDTEKCKWVNVYRHFTKELIWPRGLPLDEIRSSESGFYVSQGSDLKSPIQQGLVNQSPDVDAIWRLTQDRPFSFSGDQSVYLEPGLWCPFNTQSTWWWPEVYPLLYIPSYCSFRMCDIWKSFVAQRCLWELGQGVTFHPPEVDQERNEHSLIKDFEDEIPGYMNNQAIVACLEKLSLTPGAENVLSNFVRCYEALVDASFFPKKELKLVRAWASDIESFKE